MSTDAVTESGQPSTEVSVANAYCVVYRLENSEWAVTGEGWSQVHLYKDEADNTHRVVAWTVSDFKVVLNCNVTHLCKYKKKSPDFHKFQDENSAVFGFGFYKKEESLKEADRFMAKVLAVINAAKAVVKSLQDPVNLASVASVTIPSALSPSSFSPPPGLGSGLVARSPRSPPASSSALLSANNNQTRARDSSRVNSMINLGTRSTPVSPIINTNTPLSALSFKGTTSSAASNNGAGAVSSAAVGADRRQEPRRGTVMDRIQTLASTTGQPILLSGGTSASPPTQPRKPIPPPLPPAHGASSEQKASSSTNPSPTNVSAPQQPASPKRASFLKDPTVNPTAHTTESKQMDDYYIKGVPPLGKLKILPPKHARAFSNGVNENITDPYGVIHTQHVKYDALTRSYKGLPADWEAALKKQFGLPPNRVETVKLEAYHARIPAVLVQMKDYLISHGGLQVEGIFRIAPDADECTFVKRQLNDNTFVDCKDINCLSNLIKVWFRELPQNMLDVADKAAIHACDDEAAAGRIIAALPEPNQSIMNWLLDLCVEVMQHQAVNKMSAQNMAVVIAPNLFSTNESDKMASLIFSQRVANFFHKAILFREKQWIPLQ